MRCHQYFAYSLLNLLPSAPPCTPRGFGSIDRLSSRRFSSRWRHQMFANYLRQISCSLRPLPCPGAPDSWDQPWPPAFCHRLRSHVEDELHGRRTLDHWNNRKLTRVKFEVLKNSLVFTEAKGRYSFPVRNRTAGSNDLLNHTIWNFFTDVAWNQFFCVEIQEQLQILVSWLTNKYRNFGTFIEFDGLVDRKSSRGLCVKLWTGSDRRAFVVALDYLEHEKMLKFLLKLIQTWRELTGGAYIWCGGGCRVWLFEYIVGPP